MVGLDENVDREDFDRTVEASLGRPLPEAWCATTPIGELDVDEVALFDLVASIEALNPYFRVPVQMSLADASLADLYYYACLMTEHHLEPEDR